MGCINRHTSVWGVAVPGKTRVLSASYDNVPYACLSILDENAGLHRSAALTWLSRLARGKSTALTSTATPSQQ